MKKTERLKLRLEAKDLALKEAYKAYQSLLSGNVQRYILGSRELTRLDLAKLSAEIEKLENEIDQLEAEINGGSRRRTIAVLPRDW